LDYGGGAGKALGFGFTSTSLTLRMKMASGSWLHDTSTDRNQNEMGYSLKRADRF